MFVISEMGIRILHSAHMTRPLSGIIRQMEEEQFAAKQLDIPWTTVLYGPVGTTGSVVKTPEKNLSKWKFKAQYYRWLKSQEASYDLIMMRYSMYDPMQLKFLYGIGIPVMSVHHTRELPELLSSGTYKGKIRERTERTIGQMNLKKVAGFIAVSREVADYQRTRSGNPNMPTFIYSNGAVYDDNSLVPARYVSDVPEILFVASSFFPWAGLDLVIGAARNSSRQFKVHVVGHVDDAQRELLKSDSRFVCHGVLDHESIRKLMAQSVIGFSAFAMHRKNMTEGNALKVREYLRAGLPVYAGNPDIFEDDFPYYRYGIPDFERILGFAEEMSKVDRKHVSELARPIIEKKAIVGSLYNELDNFIHQWK